MWNLDPAGIEGVWLETREKEGGCQDGLGDRDGEIARIGLIRGNGHGSKNVDGIKDEYSKEGQCWCRVSHSTLRAGAGAVYSVFWAPH